MAVGSPVPGEAVVTRPVRSPGAIVGVPVRASRTAKRARLPLPGAAGAGETSPPWAARRWQRENGAFVHRLVPLVGTAAVTAVSPGAGGASGPGGESVDYHGLRIPVPAGWEVHRLGAGSDRCVRFDRHALYLGTAGQDQLCPAHVIGRTAAIHVEPLTEQTASLVSGMTTGSSPTPVGGLPGVTVRDPVGRQLRVALPSAGVLVTGAYDAASQELERLLGKITREPALPSGERRSGPARRWTTGPGFDTCAAPSPDAMRAWRRKFVAANIYIGGPARACPDGWLSHDWIDTVRAMGWRLIPTYVGPQAPCTRSHVRFSPDTAAIAGQVSSVDAVVRARDLGLPPKTPIYVDLEAYHTGDPLCRDAVLTYLDSWTRGIRALGYTSGVYSSLASGIRDLAQADGIMEPTAIWFAHWDKKADPYGDSYMVDEWWPGHRRIKQYRGDHVEKHGGVKLHIDSDAVAGYVD